MADSNVQLNVMNGGSDVDTRTESTNNHHRQVVVLGDPTTNNGVAPVDATNGLAVELKTAIPAGTNAIGKLAANSGVDIGDVDVTSVAGTVTVDATGQGDVPITLDGEAVVLGAGTAGIGKLTANSGVDIGDVDVISSALPTGASTSANQTTGNSSLSTIAGDTTSIDGKITVCDTGSIAGTVTANAGTNLNTSALATESGGNLDTISSDTTSIDGKITACNTGAVVIASGSINTIINDVNIADGGNVISVDDAGGSLTIDGTITANAGTNLNTSALALDSTLTDDSQKSQIIDGSGNVIGATSNALDVNIKSGAGSGGTSSTDDSAFSIGSTGLTPVGGTFTTDTIDAGDTGAFKMNAKRELFIVQDTAANLNITEVNSGTIAGDTTSIDGKMTACNTGAVVIASGSINTIINDVNIADGGNSITVDGAVTANAGTNLNTSALATESGGNLDTISGDTTSIDGKITACNTGAVVVSSGTITAVTDITNTVTVDGTVTANPASGTIDTVTSVTAIANALPAGTNAIGKLAANSGVDIGDVDVLSLPVKAADVNYFNAIVDNADFTTARVVQTATAAKKIYITSFCISVSAAGNYWLQDEDDNQITGKFHLAANGGVVMTFSPDTPLVLDVVNKALEVKGTVAGAASVTVSGYIV